MNAIVLTIDRLRASALGAYGNTWFETPEFDRLASESFLFDQALIDSPDLARLFCGCLSGNHALQFTDNGSHGETVIDHLRSRAGRSTWISDETDPALDKVAESFDEAIVLSPYNESDAEKLAVADSIESSRQAQLWEAVMSWLAEQDAARRAPSPEEKNAVCEEPDANTNEPFLLWVHAQGMGGPWDAPLELRNSLVEEDEPEPPQDTSIPNRMLPEDFDPDEVHGAACCYAGQVMALDACLGALLDMLRESSLLQDTMIVVLGLRGFPLGEHRRLGPNDEPLHEELTHVPCMMRMPDGAGALGRSQQLLQGPDLCATLFDWFDLPRPATHKYGQSWLSTVQSGFDHNDLLLDRPRRPFALITDGDSHSALRTPAWYFVKNTTQPDPDNSHSTKPQENAMPQESTIQLFAKPDDRWEQNEVSALCSAVVDSLTTTLEEIECRVQKGEPTDSIALDDLILSRSD